MTRSESEKNLIKFLGIPAEVGDEKIGNTTVHYLKAGSGSPIVLLHGINVGWGEWYRNIAVLSETNTVYALDLPGAGGSTAVSYKNVDLEVEYVELVQKFIFKKDLKRAILIGHSFGGWIILRLIIRGEVDIAKAILVSPLGFTDAIPPKFYPVAFRPIARMMAAGPLRLSKKNLEKIIHTLAGPLVLDDVFLDYYYLSLKEQEANGDGHPFFFINRLLRRFGFRRELHVEAKLLIKAPPTLMMLGENDPLVSLKHAKDAVRGIDVITTYVFEHTGHVPCIEESITFNQKALDFIREGA